MSQHDPDPKRFCNCLKCEESRTQRRKMSNRKIPPFVIQQIIAKRMKEEEDMLSLGYIKLPCTYCGHESFMKIGPKMKCQICLTVQGDVS